MDDLVLRLQSQAREIAAQGVAGWGNTMTDAADHIEQLKRENAELRRDAERIFDAGWRMAAGWCGEDHILADMDSDAYQQERRKAIDEAREAGK